MTWRIHLCVVCSWSTLVILLVGSVCTPTEALEVKQYDGTCTESANEHCDTDDNKSIQVKSTYEIIASFGATLYNSVKKFMKGFVGIKEILDTPSIIVWKFWVTILETIEKYCPNFFSLLFITLAAITNVLMWYIIRVPLLNILRSDAILLLIYHFIGAKLVVEYFPSFLSSAYRMFYVLIIEYPLYTAVIFLLLSFYNWWEWIPRKIMRSLSTRMTKKMVALANTMLPLAAIKAFSLIFTRRSQTEQLLLDIREEQYTLKENQAKILEHLEALEEKVQASINT